MNKTKRARTSLSAIGAVLLGAALAGCETTSTPSASSAAESRAAPVTATAQLKPTQGNTAAGTVSFTQQGLRVDVRVQVTGLTPNQEHGFHVHEKGDCSAPDASSAGAHFNTTGTKHGAREHMSAHTGDMGNIVADDSGKAHDEYVDTKMKLEGDSSVIGKAVIVHEKTDDQVTQPTGNSGNRVACGVIQAAK